MGMESKLVSGLRRFLEADFAPRFVPRPDGQRWIPQPRFYGWVPGTCFWRVYGCLPYCPPAKANHGGFSVSVNLVRVRSVGRELNDLVAPHARFPQHRNKAGLSQPDFSVRDFPMPKGGSFPLSHEIRLLHCQTLYTEMICSGRRNLPWRDSLPTARSGKTRSTCA